MDFSTTKAASTASGIIQGFDTVGQIIGGRRPGWADKLVGQGHDNWLRSFYDWA